MLQESIFITLRKIKWCQVKVDLTNAFNSIRQDRMLRAVEECIPEFLPFLHSMY